MFWGKLREEPATFQKIFPSVELPLFNLGKENEYERETMVESKDGG